ncbi:MBL fold metallo-hydrolase [Neptunomonas marina]|uniref:MBL fold metallo-hydrolase n=1 Tax=Neptunomonas marina TaxID=1815562 RepID=A0A437QEL1_9GAMM|nr:MBL fold metallo-hydrolase [Neptunomonas marina]RVU32875.1 MBL fold metallo-hydrolase [Neptunomonas marina]
MLKVKFLGAYEGITGSCSWLWHTDSDTQFLVDCGMHQGTHEEEWKNYKPFEFEARKIQYVLLTHAHIDHCGLLPKLVKNGFKGWVYCTQATRDIAELMLRDAAKISDLFNESDVNLIKWHVIDVGGFHWNKTLRLSDGLSVVYKRGSHVLGACSVSIMWSDKDHEGLKSIHFSGDIGSQIEGNCYLPIMKDDHYPYPKSDYIVVESTYGATERDSHFKNHENRINELGSIISKTVFENNGTVLIPAFSFHRTQELIFDILAWQWKYWGESSSKDLMGALIKKEDESSTYESPLRVLCDSPLGSKVNKVYGEQLLKILANGKYQYLNSELADRLKSDEKEVARIFRDLDSNGWIYRNGHIVKCLRPEDREKKKSNQRINKNIKRYGVIIASSGMCDHGPVVSYLKEISRNPNNTIVLTGYQSQGSMGRYLLERSEAAPGNETGANIVNMSGFYSAHGDQEKIVDYIFSLGTLGADSRSARVFINHGEATSKSCLQGAIRHRADQAKQGDRLVSSVEIARSSWFDLSSGRYLEESNDRGDTLIDRLSSIEDKLSRLTDELANLQLDRVRR